MDIDAEKLTTVGTMVKYMLETEMPDVRVELTQSRAEAIQDMDFILCQIRVGGLKARHLDESIPAEMGLVGQETTGPGGFSMALRTIPVMVEIAQDIEHYNPGAWLINYTNPTGLVAEAIKKTCNIKEISIWPAHGDQEFLALCGCLPESLFIDYFGLNHLGFARRVLLRGNDILPCLGRPSRKRHHGRGRPDRPRCHGRPEKPNGSEHAQDLPGNRASSSPTFSTTTSPKRS